MSTRIELALEMIKPIPEREWGWVTNTAEKLGVSRKFLYDLQTQGLESLAEGLLPQKTGDGSYGKEIKVTLAPEEYSSSNRANTGRVNSER